MPCKLVYRRENIRVTSCLDPQGRWTLVTIKENGSQRRKNVSFEEKDLKEESISGTECLHKTTA